METKKVGLLSEITSLTEYRFFVRSSNGIETQKKKRFYVLILMNLCLAILLLRPSIVEAQITVPDGYNVQVFAITGYTPTGIGFDSSGNLFVAMSGGDQGTSPILKITPSGIVDYFGGYISDADDVAVDSFDNVFVAGGDRITKIAQDGTATTVVSNFNNLNAISIDESNNLFVGESNGLAYKVEGNTTVSAIIAENGQKDFGTISGVIIKDNKIIISDCELDRVIELDLITGTVTIITDEVLSPQRGTFGPSGDIFIPDAAKGQVLKISQDDSQVIITPFVSGLINPYGLAFSSSGDLFVSDSGNNRILKISKTVSEMPDDTLAPTGAIHAQSNVLWSPDDFEVSVGLTGYVVDELSIARDGGGIGVSAAHIEVGTPDLIKVILKDEITDLLNSDGKFSIFVDVPAQKDAVYNVSLYASDTEPTESGGPNSGLVDSTEIHLPTCLAIDVDGDSYSVEMGDCNDNDPLINPGVIEDCDGKDNNCDGEIDEGFDVDGDGYSSCGGDCDDNNASINSGSVELPGNDIDENCDGSLGACDPNDTWKNHGEFVRCVAHEAEDLVAAGIITEEEGDILVSSAAQSEVGKK